MKTYRWLSMWGAVLVMCLVACSQKDEGTAQPSSETGRPVSSLAANRDSADLGGTYERIPPSLTAMPEMFMGTVLRNEEDLVLSTSRGDFELEGKDASDMVGSTVRVTGAVREENGRKIIRVESVDKME